MKYEREVGAPAPTLTGGVSAWTLDRRQGGAPVRRANEPAHTMAAQGLGKGRDVWVYVNGNQENVGRRRTTTPAPTLLFGHRSNDVKWERERPATTIAGDSRVFQPGGHHEPGEQSQNAVRVTVQQAATLQTFPPDYPWQGSRTKQFEQIGNAVPPMLAEAVLRALLTESEIR